MVVTVTGATGFLGRRLVRHLLQDGLVVRCAVRPTSDVDGLRQFVGEDLWTRVELARVNLLRSDDCRRLLEQTSVVYHLAAALRGSPAVLFASTVVATRRLVEAAVDSPLRRFVLVSSLGIYAAGELSAGSTLDESCPVDPKPHLRDAYTYSKAVQEEVCWQAFRQNGLPLVVVRPGVIYGDERGCLSSRVGLQVGGLLVRIGGRDPLPYTYVENCAEAVALAGLVPGLEGQVVNVVDDQLPTGRQLLRELRRRGQAPTTFALPRRLVGLLARCVEWASRRTRGQIPPVVTRYWARHHWSGVRYSNRRAKELLGWRPSVSLGEALDRTLSS